MKKIVLAIFAFIVSASLFAQIKDPVSWKYEVVKQTGNSYQLTITATVPKPYRTHHSQMHYQYHIQMRYPSKIHQQETSMLQLT